MARPGSIVRFLNSELRIRRFRDSSCNGLQVRASKEVRKIGFAVDASIAVFEKAARKGCDLVIVHHGIKWKGQRDGMGNQGRRIAFLKQHRISLYACHLPLDAHPKYGNNAQLARILGLEKRRKFGRYKGRPLGYKGLLPSERTTGWIARRLREEIGVDCTVLAFGRKWIRSVGVVSGGAADCLAEAAKARLDCFVTGEAPHQTYHEARDARINVVLGGHYATETVGVRALMPLLRERFGVRTVFIDVPTSI